MRKVLIATSLILPTRLVTMFIRQKRGFDEKKRLGDNT
jgi:hypothetical protein